MHRKSDGRYRPRLVIKGFQQVPGLDFTNSYAPVAGYHIFRLVLSIAASETLTIKTYDCSTAFAQNPLEEIVYIDIPEGYEDYCKPIMQKKNLKGTRNKVLLHKKTINGLVQGAYNQYKNMEKIFTEEKFKVNPHEPGLFCRTSSNGIILIALWVDDFLLAYSRNIDTEAMKMIEKITPKILLKETKGRLLGMELIKKEDAFYLSCEQYIDDKITDMRLPIKYEKKFRVMTPLNNREEISPNDAHDPNLTLQFQQLIGSLIHASNCLRFDITFADKKLVLLAQRVLNYLYTTKDFKLKFKKKGVEIENKMSKLTAYVDADFAGDIVTRRSTTGMIVCLDNMPIYWRSKLQTSVATRTAEAEIIALYDTTQETLYYRNILNNMNIIQGPIDIFEDNQAAIAIMNRPEKKTKMDSKYFKVQELIQENIINIKYVKSENNLSDLMTKSLPKATHIGIIKRLGLLPSHQVHSDQ